jgi:hypothetical protein
MFHKLSTLRAIIYLYLLVISAPCTAAANTVYVAGATFVNVTMQDCQTHCKTDPTCTFYTYSHTTRVWITVNVQGLTCHTNLTACLAPCKVMPSCTSYIWNTLKVPKSIIFVTELFTINPILVGDEE